MATPRTFSEISQLTVYKDLRSTIAERSRPAVAFVGAGLGMGVGLPSWASLKSDLLQELREKASRAGSQSEARKLAEESESIQGISNLWAAFGRLEITLGKTTYQSTIRKSLSPGDTLPIPGAYTALWRMPIEGIITTNLDNFVKRSFSEVYPGRDLKWFIGKEAGRLTRLLHSGHAFAYSLHGSIDDSQSWVFTQEQLRGLYGIKGYKDMLKGIFSSYTVLFLGISADDIAVGSPLENLARANIEGPTHFWLTDRNDPETEAWAEKTGIRVIPYTTVGGDHSIVGEVLNDLASAVGEEVEAPPVLLSSGEKPPTLPSPEEMVIKPLSEIRRLLNDRAVELLDGPDGEKAYEYFLREYEESVHRAWFIPTAPGLKELFGYQLGERVARGAFGQVYRSVDSEGRQVAVKVLLEEIMHDGRLLASFRRGVQAMRILDKHHSHGMVTYQRASEIPTFVVMEWVEGPNLTESKDAGLLKDWTEILWVSHELISVIKRAHDLPERVLHRDIRPANIMLEDGWLGFADWKLVVLDFDLSTYRGAHQKSFLAKESALGFLAPEQLDARSSYSTRNAAVDSFGIGMTLMFLCSGSEPEAYAQRRPNFEKSVNDATSKPENTSWLSLPRRFARLVISATQDEQPNRWDLAQMQLEIRRLQQVQGGDESADTDLLCEEIAARCEATISTTYEWNTDNESLVVRRPGGLRLAMHGPRDEDKIQLSITWAATGVEERGSVAKYLPEKIQRCAAALRSGPWDNVRYEQQKMDMSLTAVLATSVARKRLDDAADSLSKAVSALNFVLSLPLSRN